MILALQGCMAVGKTSAVRYLKENAPWIHVCEENNTAVIEEVKRRKLNKNIYEDYLEIQKLWLMHEVERYEAAQKYPCTVMDYGAEEIEFYTLNYPRALGESWEIEEALYKELSAVRKCMPDRILFLDASKSVLRMRKENDAARSREFFDFYLTHMLPLKKEWFSGRKNVDILKVDNMRMTEVGEYVRQWAWLCTSDNCLPPLSSQ